jgi:hypothetical protein
MFRKKEFIVHADSQTFLIREGESRRVNMPVMLSMKDGILNISYPDNYHEEIINKPARRLAEALKEEESNPCGAPAPSSEDLA